MASFRGQFEDAGYVIQVLSRVLTQLIDVNHKSNTRQHFVTKFQSSYAPQISILAYLERINKYAKCSPNCFIVALVYIDRLIEMRNIVLTSLNVHRILITSVLISTKVFDDEFYKNAYYAKLGGVTTAEMNSLELEFLSLVNFNLFVSTETFEKYQNELGSFVSVSSPTLSNSLSVPSSSDMSSLGSCDSSHIEQAGLYSDLSRFGKNLLCQDDTLAAYTPSPPPDLCSSRVGSSSSFFSDSSDYGSSAMETVNPFGASGGNDGYGGNSDYPGCGLGMPGLGHNMMCPRVAPSLSHTNSAPVGCYSAFSTTQQCVDQLPMQWPPAPSLGVAHSHQSYPPARMQHPSLDPQQHPFYPPTQMQRPPPRQMYQMPPAPLPMFYPPSTSTPTSVVDAFRPPSHFPSPSPYQAVGSPAAFPGGQHSSQRLQPCKTAPGLYNPCDMADSPSPSHHRPSKPQIVFPAQNGGGGVVSSSTDASPSYASSSRSFPVAVRSS